MSTHVSEQAARSTSRTASRPTELEITDDAPSATATEATAGQHRRSCTTSASRSPPARSSTPPGTAASRCLPARRRPGHRRLGPGLAGHEGRRPPPAGHPAATWLRRPRRRWRDRAGRDADLRRRPRRPPLTSAPALSDRARVRVARARRASCRCAGRARCSGSGGRRGPSSASAEEVGGVAAGRGGGQEGRRVVVQAAAHRRQPHRARLAAPSSSPSHVHLDQPVQRRRAAPRRRRTCAPRPPVEQRDDDVGRRQRDPPVGGQAVVARRRGAAPAGRRRRPAAPPPAARRARAAALTRLAGRHAGEAPAGAGAEVARALGDHGDVGAAARAGPRAAPCARVTASRSPPNAWPTVTRAASQPAARSPATVRENQTGSAPPSVIT